MAGCGTQSTSDRQGLSGSECKAWEAKQEQGKKDVAATKGALAAYRADPGGAQGKTFAGAMTKAFGEGGLSAGNLAKLDKALGKLEGFYNDPGTAQGGKYDLYKAGDWSGGGTIRGGQVAFGTGYFASTGTHSRMATIHEPMHLQGFQMGRDMQMKYPNGYYYGVYGPGSVQTYARSNPAGAQNNIESWACLIARACN
ncbi:hypothetical protein [Caulobacter sp. DWR1-3-2b1]|uniref:hypothetical protein n=1 Tax=Caulobacter sp. DWR1-3-2b1 TaxID=2804670 RepID=UPI003CF850D3